MFFFLEDLRIWRTKQDVVAKLSGFCFKVGWGVVACFLEGKDWKILEGISLSHQNLISTSESSKTLSASKK